MNQYMVYDEENEDYEVVDSYKKAMEAVKYLAVKDLVAAELPCAAVNTKEILIYKLYKKLVIDTSIEVQIEETK